MEEGRGMRRGQVKEQAGPRGGGAAGQGPFAIFLCCLLTPGRAVEELTHTSQGGDMMCVR